MISERPRSLLLSLGVPSRPSPGSQVVPSRFAMCFILQCFGPIQVPRWGPPRPVLVPSWSRAFLPESGLDGPKQTSWPLLKISNHFEGLFFLHACLVHLVGRRFEAPHGVLFECFWTCGSENPIKLVATLALRSRPDDR